jgi:hypothetical protein
MFSSTHIAFGCLDASDAGEAWKKERRLLQNRDYKPDIVFVPRTGEGQVSPAQPAKWFGRVASWTGAWNALIRFTDHLPTITGSQNTEQCRAETYSATSRISHW